MGSLTRAQYDHGRPRLRRAPLPLRILVPRRGVASGGARIPCGGARLRGARAHRSRRRLRLARVRARRQVRGNPADHRRRGDTQRRRLDGAARERRCRLCRRRSGGWRSARHAALRERQGLREPLPHPDRGPCRNASGGQGGPRAPAARRPPRDRGGAERGARLPLRLRARRACAPRSGRCCAARRRVRTGAVLRRAAASLRAGRLETPRGPPRPRRAPPRGDGRDGERACPCPAADAAPGRARRDPLPHLARRVRAGAAREPRGGAPRPGRDGRALRRARPCRGRAHGSARRAPDVRPHRGARLPLPRLLRQRRSGDPSARTRSATTRSASATAQAARCCERRRAHASTASWR